jgi:hypothetical protein
MKPIAWYDPTNGMVSTDQDSPLFTPLGQVWGLYLKEEAKDEPVAHMNQNGVVRKVGYEWGPNNTLTALYAAPSQSTFLRLTDEEIVLIVAECAASHQHTDIHFARAIEAKLKEKNT